MSHESRSALELVEFWPKFSPHAGLQCHGGWVPFPGGAGRTLGTAGTYSKLLVRVLVVRQNRNS